MNIKKFTLKTMCAVLTCTTLLSSLLAVSATGAIITETPMDEPVSDESNWIADEGSLEEIEVTYKQSSSYNVTIPKTIELDTSKQAVYSVKVTGEIDANERVHVVPVDGISDTESIDFYMKDQTTDSRKADVVATVTQNKFYWNSEEVTNGYEEASNSVSAPDLTAGTWKGTFQVAINLESNTSHEHNYIDGVCTECGAKDPNHTHNYVETVTEEPTCTGAGEKTYACNCGDSYIETMPATGHNYVNGVCDGCGEKYKSYSVYGMGYQCTGSSFYNVYYSRHSTYYTNVCYEVPASALADSTSLCFALSSSTSNLQGWLYYSPSRIPYINNTGTSVKMPNWPSGSYRVFEHKRVNNVSTLVLTQPSYESTGYYYIFIEGPGNSNGGVYEGSVFVTRK